MKKIRLINVVVPELVAYMSFGDEKVPDYRCPVCGFGVAEEYVCCPHCMSELNWFGKDKKSEEFKKIINNL